LSIKHTFQLICLGRSTVDLLNLVDHFPCDDDLIRVLDSSIQGGGPVATAAAAASRLGLRCAILDCIGDDWRAVIIRTEFEKQGVCVEYLQQAPECESTQSVILVEAPTGKRAIINARGKTPPPSITPAWIDLLQSCAVLHITGTYAEMVLSAISIVSEAGGRISFDGGAGLFREEDRRIIEKVNWCIFAEDYARQLTGLDDVPSMLASISAMGPEIVGITSGTNGSDWWVEDGSQFHQDAFPVTPVVDTTGCGDSFHGAFIFAMLNGYTIKEAARIASAVAAMNARVLGGRAGLPDLQMVHQFIHSL